jgi:hypothetical protein
MSTYSTFMRSSLDSHPSFASIKLRLYGLIIGTITKGPRINNLKLRISHLKKKYIFHTGDHEVSAI